MSVLDWQPVHPAEVIRAIRTGELTGPIPTLMARTDGVCLIYGGEVHSFAGEPEAGKGLLIGGECARILPAERVLYLDFEDTAASIFERLLALGATDAQIIEHLVYVRPDTPPTAQTIPALLALGPFALAVIDGLSEAYVLLGLDPYSNVDAAKFLAALPRPIAETGTPVAQIDHVVKATESRGRYAIGAQHKLAGIAVAYNVEAVKPPNRLQPGLLKVRITKDRHGHVRGHAEGDVIALVDVVPANGGETVTVTLRAPDAGAGGGFRPTFLMERVSRYLDGSPGATTNEIRALKGNANAIRDGLRILVAEGYVEVRQEGQAHRHHNLRRFTETDDRDHRDQTETELGPDPGPDDRDHRDHPPLGGPGPGPGHPAHQNGQPGPTTNAHTNRHAPLDEERAEDLLTRHADLDPTPTIGAIS